LGLEVLQPGRAPASPLGANLLPITSSQDATPESTAEATPTGAAEAEEDDDEEDAAGAARERSADDPPVCDASRSPLYCVYTVQPGDTLSLIATEFGLESTETVANWQLLVESNRPDIISAEAPILAGQNLRIPSQTGLIHLVLGGESLGGIAEAFGVSTAEIVAVAANNLSEGQSLLVGQEILVPAPSQLGLPASEAPAEEPTPEPTPQPTETATPANQEPPARDAGAAPEVTDTPEATATPEPEAAEQPADEDAASPADEEPAPPTVVAPESSYPFIWPVAGPISSYFGPSHPLGIDIDLYNAPNAPIGASAAGIVTFAGGDPCCSYGLYVIVDHGNGYRTLYAHLSELHVQAGQFVAQGQVVGLAGLTGYSTGNHLHFEVHLHGAYIDPLTVLP
jgi:murein DD-endopeptidase MepM/ murein hydrolase activator NlpD